jgi:glycosyltransferase involved in cell wall biosynthesis
LLVYADRNPWMQWATRYVMHHSDALVGDCDPVRQKAVSYGMSNERIVTFPWGIDLDHFLNQEMPETQPETFTLLSTRSWEPIYGVDVVANAFVEVIAHLKKSKGETFARGVKLVMLGAGRQANMLRMIFEQAGVSDQVYFPGLVSLAELPDYYAQANIYISASHSDGTSISLLEAMACGRPVLVSDIPGNRQWITQGVEGWLFPDGNVQALAELILKAIELRSQLTAMGSAARKLVEQKADWQVNFRMLLHAYNIAEKYAQQS